MDFNDLISIAPFGWIHIAATLFVGGLIGFERQFRGKPVGIRTSSLIVLGTYLFVAASNSTLTSSADPTRVVGQVITGIGFLGAGVMMTKDGAVLGVTSASTIWVLAALGVCIGLDNIATAVKLSFVVIIVLFGIEMTENYFHMLTQGVHNKLQHWKSKAQE